LRKHSMSEDQLRIMHQPDHQWITATSEGP
jgi:hypothetical protein